MHTLDVFRRIEKQQRGHPPRNLPVGVLDLVRDLIEQMGLSAHVPARSKPESLNGLMNKLSPETYREVAPLILRTLTPESYEDLFSILSTNSFFAALYADLCASLAADHPAFHALLQEKLAAVSLDDLSDTNRARTAFFAALGAKGVVPNSKLADMARGICDGVKDSWDDAANRDKLAEWAEHLFILVNTSVALHRPIAESVSFIAAAPLRPHPGLTNKTLFRFMDITDRFAQKRF